MSMQREGELLRLDGAVTMSTVPALLVEARAACRDGARCIDFAAVSEADSAAIALALELKREAVARQASLAFQNLPPGLHKLIALYGVAEHLQP
jgi:phospholipid transport system transporter-binding protein